MSEGVTRNKLTWRQATAGASAVALLFSLFVIVQMVGAWEDMLDNRPIDHPLLVELRAELAQEPGSDAIRDRIRSEEVVLRSAYHTAVEQLRRGAWLLLVGFSLFLATAKLSLSARRKPPVLEERGTGFDPDGAPRLFGRASLVGLAVLLAVSAVTIPILGEESAEVEVASGVWTRFRGPGGAGVSPYVNVPQSFDARDESPLNLRWKSVVPMPGLSSPVVWNDRVFLTGASKNNREVYCYDALSGALLWRKPVSAGPQSSQSPERIWDETTYAAPTAVTDGAHVWALFANGDVICLDVFGQESWCVNLGLPENIYGLSASPLLHDGKLIVQLDQERSDEHESALWALDAATGAEIWKATRDVDSSWPSPILIEAPDGVQILTCANPFVIAYDPEDGSEIWRVDCLEGDGGPSPIFAGGLVLAVNVASPLTAIRPDGKGDVTDTHVAWTWDDGLPDVCSPLAGHGLLWLLSTDGWQTCLDLATGERVWEHEHDTMFYASPSLVGDRVLLIGRRGDLIVHAAEREYRELATGHVGENCDTSPAFAEGRIYVRGRRHLLCFEEPAP